MKLINKGGNWAGRVGFVSGRIESDKFDFKKNQIGSDWVNFDVDFIWISLILTG
jgi:hypothetical protein